jgi:hypothetical protein
VRFQHTNTSPIFTSSKSRMNLKRATFQEEERKPREIRERLAAIIQTKGVGSLFDGL